MAANLNRPVDFIRETGAMESSTLLIPPSAFEKPAAPSNQKHSDKLMQQIKQLQEENEKIRSSQSQAHFQTHGNTGVSQGHYVDELIKRQTEEISELRSELMKARQLNEQDHFELEKKLRICEENHEQELNRVLKQSRLTEEHLEDRVERLSSELQRALEIGDRETLEWKDKYETMSSSLKQRLDGVENEKISWQRTIDARIHELEADNRNKAQVINDQIDTISKLKTYIGEKESSQKSLSVWSIEKETLDNQLKVAQAENNKWQSHLELLEIRFKSLNEILTVQEGDMSKAKKDGLGRAKQHSIMLNRWREKVFSLLVQQKSSEISYKNSLNTARDNILQLEEELGVGKAQEEVLQCSLIDKEAQLQMAAHNKLRLEEELDEAKQVAMCLDDQSKENEAALQCMKLFIEGMVEKYQSVFKSVEEKSNQLKVLCQRVSFAASRMDLLKSQIVRRTAMTTSNNTSNINNDSKKSMSVSRGDEDISRDSEEYLYQELERVMRERDSLATQVRDDSTKWSKKMSATQTQYFTELSTLKRTVEDLEYDIQQRSKKCVQLTEDLESLRETDREKDDTIANLQAELARYAKGTDTILTDQKLKDEALYTEKMSQMEQHMNDSKREHAKTVVILRQQDRNHSREMERSKDLLLTTEQHLNSQIEQLKNQLMSLEKERNTLVATLRQEGLLTKLKSDRPEPMHLALDVNPMDQGKDAEEDYLSLNKNLQSESNTDGYDTIQTTKDDEPKKFRSYNQGPEIVSARGVPEPVENVIKDLKSLTAAIFDDSDEDQDSFH